MGLRANDVCVGSKEACLHTRKVAVNGFHYLLIRLVARELFCGAFNLLGWRMVRNFPHPISLAKPVPRVGVDQSIKTMSTAVCIHLLSAGGKFPCNTSFSTPCYY